MLLRCCLNLNVAKNRRLEVSLPLAHSTQLQPSQYFLIRKQSQYNFRHLLFLQLQKTGFSVDNDEVRRKDYVVVFFGVCVSVCFLVLVKISISEYCCVFGGV